MNGENLTAKTPPGDFKVTTLEIPLLSQQAVTSKGIPISYTNLQLNPYPNTQLNLFCDTPIWLIVWCVWVCDESHIGYLLGWTRLY